MKYLLTKVLLFTVTIHAAVCKEDLIANKKKVCVIGAGPCGLAAVKNIIKHQFEPIAFERNSDVGGLWIYTDKTDFDEYGLPVHSSMYKNLRTNAPKELMTYQDYRDFHGENHRCVGHETVLNYLKNYTNHFDLRQYIQFNTYVERVTPVSKKRNTKWYVDTKNLTSNTRKRTVCDALMVCNGNLFQPNIPTIPGIDKFQGRVLHSASYRKPEEFTNQTVAILGASFSGLDIAIELSDYTEKIYLSHRHDKITSELPSMIEQVPGVVKADNSRLILSNGTAIFADALIMCTGFRYSFPFLDSKSGVIVDNGKFVHPVYMNLLNVNYTTMSLLGLPRDNVGFSVCDLQARYFLSVFRGDVELPSYDEMVEASKTPAGSVSGQVHNFGPLSWGYYADLAKASNSKGLPPFYEKGLTLWLPLFRENLLTFRDYDLHVLDDENVEIVKWKDT